METKKSPSLLFVPLLLLTVVSLACSLGSQAPVATGVPVATSAPATAVPTLSGDPTSVVVHAFQLLPTLSYRKQEWFASGQGGTLDTTQPPTLVAEFTPPNNSYVVWGENEYLTLGSNFYSRTTGGAWSLDVPGALNQNAAEQMSATLTKMLQDGSFKAVAAGSDSVNGVPAQVFQVNLKADPGITISMQLWIGGDGRLVKMVLEDPNSGQVLDVSLYEYDPGIQLPTP